MEIKNLFPICYSKFLAKNKNFFLNFLSYPTF